jgi:hypothetical protein
MIDSGITVVIIFTMERFIRFLSIVEEFINNKNNNNNELDIRPTKFGIAGFCIAISIEDINRSKNCSIMPIKIIRTTSNSILFVKTFLETLNILFQSIKEKIKYPKIEIIITAAPTRI